MNCPRLAALRKNELPQACSVTNNLASLAQFLNSLINMRIWKGFLLCELSNGNPSTTTSKTKTVTSESTATPTCDVGELKMPKNGKRWTCVSDDNKPNNEKCFLNCDDGYAVENSKFGFGRVRLKLKDFHLKTFV